MKTSSVKFRFLEHTADMGLEVVGETLEELFVHAAEGLREMIFGPLPERAADQEERIVLDGEDGEELLVGWLNELLFRLETRGFVPLSFRVERIGATGLAAVVSGVSLAGSGLRVLREVKAVTYHRLMLERLRQGWRANLYVDL
jgi:SHS2 domain-containing protein